MTTDDLLSTRLSGPDWVKMPPLRAKTSMTMTYSTERQIPPTENTFSRVQAEFVAYIYNNQLEGEDLEGNPKQYNSYDSLKTFWSKARTQKLLYSGAVIDPTIYTVESILANLLIPLSILVFISTPNESKVDSLAAFIEESAPRSSSFPLREKPRKLSEASWRGLREEQWRFAPLKLNLSECYDREFDRRAVFPGSTSLSLRRRVTGNGKNAGNNRAEMRYMELTNPEPGSKINQAVIKAYPAAAKGSYNRERKSYNSLQNSPRVSDHIIRCYGAFRYEIASGASVYCLILEYADGGSLFDLYSNTPPKSPEDIKEFWCCFLKFLHGIGKIHHEASDHAGGASVHQDLKPSNILIKYCSNDKTKFLPKICDFGESNPPTVRQGQQADFGPYNNAPCTFIAPEVYLCSELHYKVTPAMDLWAAACMIIEVAVWIHGGPTAREAFREARMAEIALKAPDLVRSGHGDCFHHKSKPLDCVRRFIDSLGKESLNFAIADVAFEQVLEPEEPENRAGAIKLKLKIDDAVAKRDSMSLGDAITPTAFGLKRPHVTIKDIEKWKEAKKRKTGQVEELPGKEDAWYLLKGRDHIFIIDDSPTMQKRGTEVLRYFGALAYLLKEADPDGVELYMTSDNERFTDKNSTALVEYARERFARPSRNKINMESTLNVVARRITETLPDNNKAGGNSIRIVSSFLPSRLLESIRKRSCQREISVYILTDGEWTKHYAIAPTILQRSIRNLANTLEVRGLPRTFVTLQFINFGDSRNSEAQLDVLDEFLPDEKDIVDHKHANKAGVWEVLIGSQDPENDKDINY